MQIVEGQARKVFFLLKKQQLQVLFFTYRIGLNRSHDCRILEKKNPVSASKRLLEPLQWKKRFGASKGKKNSALKLR